MGNRERLESNAAKLRIAATRALWAIFLLATLGCFGGNNPLNCDREKEFPPPPPSGLFLGTATTGFTRADSARAETFTLPVMVQTLSGESAGDVVTVTPTPVTGVTYYPPSADVTLAQLGMRVPVTFSATVSPTAPYGALSLGASRTSDSSSADDSQLRDSTTTQVVANLISVSITPANVSFPKGTNKQFTLSILPRGNTQGNQTLKVSYASTHGAVTLTPATFVINLVQGSTTPLERVVTVSTTDLAPERIYELSAYINNTYRVARNNFTLNGDTGGAPSFRIVASPTQVTTANHVPSSNVTFTVTSLNGFTGQVKVSWQADSEVTPMPGDNDFIVNVQPAIPATFTRQFYRYLEDNSPAHVTFSAEDIPFTVRKGTTITINHP